MRRFIAVVVVALVTVAWGPVWSWPADDATDIDLLDPGWYLYRPSGLFGMWRVAPGTWVLEVPVHKNGVPVGEMFYDINCGAPPFADQPTYRELKQNSFDCGMHHFAYDDNGYWLKHEAFREAHRYGIYKGLLPSG